MADERGTGRDGGGAAGGARVVALAVEPIAYRLIADWAARHGHRLALLVTTPGPPRSRSNRDYLDLLAAVPPAQDVLVSTRMRGSVSPAVAAVAPDLLVSFTFPYRVPAELTALPRFGAVNLHPTPLPAYRGPNPRRMLFDGAPTIGAALHRIEERFDAGAILACREAPLPAEPTPERVLDLWLGLLAEALAAGTRRALAGERGEPQDDAAASYAAPFTPDERRLDWRWPAAKLVRRTLALSLFRPEAEGTIDGVVSAIRRVAARPGPRPDRPPGTVLARDGERFVLAVGDGVVEAVVAGSLEAAAREPAGAELGVDRRAG